MNVHARLVTSAAKQTTEGDLDEGAIGRGQTNLFSPTNLEAPELFCVALVQYIV